MKPDFAVGSLERVTPTDFTRPCHDCGRIVYMRDQVAIDAGTARCLECFVQFLERTDPQRFEIMLPPGWTKARFLAMLQGGKDTVQ